MTKILQTTENEENRKIATYHLGKIGQGNLQAIAGLLKALEISEDKDTRTLAVSSLGRIVTTDEQRKGLVSPLQAHFNYETYENNFVLFQCCYKVLWNIAQELPYPDFYRAWHGLTEN
ncbi:MAG: HEAT repeat domain-containing protein [Microcoleus vaginatus WJT46-NPBG5]|nr:HEAT repeat domain-containing protein [Microcoleus vaginatus WJT46-NPBG5]